MRDVPDRDRIWGIVRHVNQADSDQTEARTRRRFFIREPFCGLSHGVGAVLAVAALMFLLDAAHGRVRETVAFALYGVSLIALYVASTLYHSLWVEPDQVLALMRIDHAAIYLLIQGSYAPICLVALHGALGSGLYGVEAVLAGLGIIFSLGWRSFPDWLRMGMFIVMGWLGILAVGPLRQAITPAGFDWLLAGGLSYTIGAAVLTADRPHLWPGRFNAHDLWHIFVLAGSTCHFIVVACFIAPPG